MNISRRSRKGVTDKQIRKFLVATPFDESEGEEFELYSEELFHVHEESESDIST